MNKISILVPLTAIILAGLFFALRPDSPAAEPKAQTFEVRIENDAMTPEEIEVREGDRVRLRVESDAPAEFHVHGYDLEREVEPGETAMLSFAADITGRFDIENHLTNHDEHEDDHSHASDDGHEHADGHSENEPDSHDEPEDHDDSGGHSHSGGIGTLTVLPR